MHSLRGTRHVIDIRNIGIVAGVELEPRAARRARAGSRRSSSASNSGVLVRVTGDTIALSPPLIVSKQQIDEMSARVVPIARPPPRTRLGRSP